MYISKFRDRLTERERNRERERRRQREVKVLWVSINLLPFSWRDNSSADDIFYWF